MNNLNHVLTSPSHEQFEQTKIQRCILTHGKNENNIMFKWEILIVFVTFQKSSSSNGDTVTWVKVGKLIQWGMFYMFQVWVKRHPKEMFFFVSFLLFRECRKESSLMKRNLRDSGSRTNVQFAVVPWHTFIQVLHDT